MVLTHLNVDCQMMILGIKYFSSSTDKEFIQDQKDNKLPMDALQKSFQNNGAKIYTNASNQI
jgi:hypothetical protein